MSFWIKTGTILDGSFDPDGSTSSKIIKRESGDGNSSQISNKSSRRRGRPKQSDLSHLNLDPKELDRRKKLAIRMRRYRKKVKVTETEEEAAERRKKQTESMRKYRAWKRENRTSDDVKPEKMQPVKIEKPENEMTAEELRRKRANERMRKYLAKKKVQETPEEAAKRRQWQTEYMKKYRDKKKRRENGEVVDTSDDDDESKSSSFCVKSEKLSDDEDDDDASVSSKPKTLDDEEKIRRIKQRNSEKMKRYWARKMSKETPEETAERRRRMANYAKEYRSRKRVEQESSDPSKPKNPPVYSQKYLQIKRIRDEKLQKESEEEARERKRIAAQKMQEYRMRKKMTTEYPEFCKFEDRRCKVNKMKKSKTSTTTKMSSSSNVPEGSNASSQQRIIYIKATSQQKMLTLCEFNSLHLIHQLTNIF